MDTWILILIGMQLLFIAFIIGVVVFYRLRTTRQQSEERLRLIDRYGSPQELAEFLTSDAGKSVEHLFARRQRDPRPRLVASVAAGAFTVLMSFAFMVLAYLRIFGDRDTFLVPALLLLGGGAGLLIAALVSWWLVRTWGLVKKNGGE